MTPAVERLRCEHLPNPVLDVAVPRLSWQVRSARRGTRQVAYQLLVASTPELLAAGAADLWDTGRVESADSVLVPYGGSPLSSRQQAHWTVRVWDDAGAVSEFAAPATWEMGLLQPGDWHAQWIRAPRDDDSAVPYFSSTVQLPDPPTWARAYVTALGLYELYVNGVRAGDALFTPGWTDYRRRLQYQAIDVGPLLRAGDNVVQVRVADGWYAGYVGFLEQRELYGTVPELLLQLEATTPAGTVVHVTDTTWSSGSGPLRRSDMLRGEEWHLAAAVSATDPVRPGAGTPAALVVSPAPPVRVTQELAPLSVERIAPDAHRIDMGQNMVGHLRLRLAGAPGDVVEVTHAEMLDAAGALYRENLRSAAALDRYVLGDDAGWCEPAMTFHGFRYADVRGVTRDLTSSDVVGVVCGTDLERIGHFECGDDRVNRLHENIVWSARGNMLEIPTDCPQRDERMGWTGDVQVFAPTACYLFDTAAFLTKWLRDMLDTQDEQGSFGDVAPLVVLDPGGSAGWADAGVLVPWTVATFHDDERLLAETYPGMRRWITYVRSANPTLLWTERRGYDNGDWLAVGADTDKELIATAFFARSTRITARTAARLGRETEAAELHALADDVDRAFRDAFLLPGGRLKSDTQTAYALALRFELIPPDLVVAAGEHLVRDIEAHDWHLTTGFLGVAHLLPVLSDLGRVDVAYRLLLTDDFPSWLFAVHADATTIWERWDGWTPDRGFQDPIMNSFNHYAFGAVGEWLYRTVGGIGFEEALRPGDSATRRLHVAVHPNAALGFARTTWRSPYGEVATSWRVQADGALDVDVSVPVGATARVVLPGEDVAAMTESGRPLDDAPHVTLVTTGPGVVELDVDPGSYAFRVAGRPRNGQTISA